MKKMRENGINRIGNGKSDDIDELRMFGSDKLLIPDHPQKIKLLFLTGNFFLREFSKKIIMCLDSGSEIDILLADPDNTDYLEHCALRFNDGKVDFAKELKADSLETIKEIKNSTKNPDNLKVRFYWDEYQNNIRISKYEKIYYYWINVQPISKAAKDLSIALQGTIDPNDLKGTNPKKEVPTEDNNVCLASESGFDKLWKMYEHTEYKREKEDIV